MALWMVELEFEAPRNRKPVELSKEILDRLEPPMRNVVVGIPRLAVRILVAPEPRRRKRDP